MFIPVILARGSALSALVISAPLAKRAVRTGVLLVFSFFGHE